MSFEFLCYRPSQIGIRVHASVIFFCRWEVEFSFQFSVRQRLTYCYDRLLPLIFPGQGIVDIFMEVSWLKIRLFCTS